MHRFLISAAHKSSGKTTVSVGLAAALRARGLTVQPFKKGPDYIDPMWLGHAAGRACRNLDFYLSPPEEIVSVCARHSAGAEVVMVEGNKGLYDGLDLHGSNSNAALAKLLDLPVVLVLDARGMTRGIAPLILGYQAFDRALRIPGVVLNRLGGSRHEAKLRAVIEHYTDVKVIGAVHEDSRLAIAERHLGLMPANEAAETELRIRGIAERIASQVDVERLLALTAAPDSSLRSFPARRAATSGLRVGVARDRAFGFYYPDDIDAFEAAGAQLVAFDTLRDERLPDIDALFIGGGFPECFLDELEANRALRGDIRHAIEAGLPAYAECGGLMYLARGISWNGRTREMVGIVPADIVMHERPVGRGYIRLAETDDHPWPATAPIPAEIAAHEFHYSSAEQLPSGARFAYRVLRGHGTDGRRDGYAYKNLLACYAHLRSTSRYDWASRFVQFARSRTSEASSVTRAR